MRASLWEGSGLQSLTPTLLSGINYSLTVLSDKAVVRVIRLVSFLWLWFSVCLLSDGNGRPLQCSCLENPRNGGAWWAAIYGVAQSRSRLKRCSSSSPLMEKGKRLMEASWWERLAEGGIGSCSNESESEVAQSCPTLCDPMDWSPLSSSIQGILHSRILEWVATSFSRRSSQPRDWTQVSRIVGRGFTVWATKEACSDGQGHIQ